LDVIFLKKT